MYGAPNSETLACTPIFILSIAKGDVHVALYKILDKSDRPIFCIRRLCVARRRKMAILANLNFYISERGQPPPTKLKALGLHFCLKARRDRANQFGSIDDEPMGGRGIMAILAN